MAVSLSVHRKLLNEFRKATLKRLSSVSVDTECSRCIERIPVIPAGSECFRVWEYGSAGWAGCYHKDCWRALARNAEALAAFDPFLGPSKDDVDREIERQAWLGEGLYSILLGDDVVHHDSGCILALNGYGDCRPRKRIRGRREPLYRITYRLYFGNLEPDVPVMHLCHVPLCIAPSHLRVGSNIENMQAAQEYSIGRWPGKDHCWRARARLEERSRFKRLYGDPNWRPGQDPPE